MDFRCELYMYSSAEGYTIHICNNRIIHKDEPPQNPYLMLMNTETFDRSEYLKAKKEYDEYLDKAERVPLDLPYAGETIIVGDAQTMLDKLIELKELGYIFPDYVFYEIAEEAIEEAANGWE